MAGQRGQASAHLARRSVEVDNCSTVITSKNEQRGKRDHKGPFRHPHLRFSAATTEIIQSRISVSTIKHGASLQIMINRNYTASCVTADPGCKGETSWQ